MDRAATKSVTCEDAIEVLSDYVDGQMDGSTKAAFQAHFADCPPCLDFLATFKTTLVVSKKVCDEQIPDEVRTRLRSFLKEKCSGKKPGSTPG